MYRAFSAGIGRLSRGFFAGDRLTQDRYLLRALREEQKRLPRTDPVLRRIVDAIESRLYFHRNMLLRTKRWNGMARIVLSLSIPILSAYLTALVAGADRQQASEIVGGMVTILTVLNSILRPAEKWLSASHMLIRLHDWEMDLVIKLRLLDGQDASEAYRLLARKDTELSQVGAEISTILAVQDAGKDLRAHQEVQSKDGTGAAPPERHPVGNPKAGR